MKFLTLTIHQHESALTGDHVHLEVDYIVSIREYTYPKSSFTEVTMITGDRFNVNETFAEIQDTLRKQGKWL
jgi:hypothetical protein